MKKVRIEPSKLGNFEQRQSAIISLLGQLEPDYRHHGSRLDIPGKMDVWKQIFEQLGEQFADDILSEALIKDTFDQRLKELAQTGGLEDIFRDKVSETTRHQLQTTEQNARLKSNDRRFWLMTIGFIAFFVGICAALIIFTSVIASTIALAKAVWASTAAIYKPLLAFLSTSYYPFLAHNIWVSLSFMTIGVPLLLFLIVVQWHAIRHAGLIQNSLFAIAISSLPFWITPLMFFAPPLAIAALGLAFLIASMGSLFLLGSTLADYTFHELLELRQNVIDQNSVDEAVDRKLEPYNLEVNIARQQMQDGFDKNLYIALRDNLETIAKGLANNKHPDLGVVMRSIVGNHDNKSSVLNSATVSKINDLYERVEQLQGQEYELTEQQRRTLDTMHLLLNKEVSGYASVDITSALKDSGEQQSLAELSAKLGQFKGKPLAQAALMQSMGINLGNIDRINYLAPGGRQ